MKLSPTPDVPVCEDFRFLGPIIILSVMRALVQKPEDELTVLHNKELNSSKFEHHASRLSAFTPRRSNPVSVYNDNDYNFEDDIFQDISEVVPPTVGDGVHHRHIRSLTHRTRYSAVQAHL